MARGKLEVNVVVRLSRRDRQTLRARVRKVRERAAAAVVAARARGDSSEVDRLEERLHYTVSEFVRDWIAELREAELRDTADAAASAGESTVDFGRRGVGVAA